MECEGTNDTLSSKEKIDRLVDLAATTGFDTLFVQVYRHDRAWYNSRLADTAPYRKIVKKEKIDPLSYLIARAHEKGLKVQAWLNMFRIGKDKQAPVLKRLGKDIITRDGSGRSLLDYAPGDLPDGGYWLDPGDKTARSYLRNIILELLKKYPHLNGIHLDFTRYPHRSAAHAGSFWAKRNDLGYGKASVKRFQEWTGLNPQKMELSRANCQAWDNWRRYQVNSFVESVYSLVRKVKPGIPVSVAVVAWADRAYLTNFQDWRRWLEEGTVDFVAVMNYSTDPRLAGYLTRTAQAARGQRKVYTGLGAYLLAGKPDVLIEQIEDALKAGSAGIVLFSYDSMLKEPSIFSKLKKKFFASPAK